MSSIKAFESRGTAASDADAEAYARRRAAEKARFAMEKAQFTRQLQLEAGVDLAQLEALPKAEQHRMMAGTADSQTNALRSATPSVSGTGRQARDDEDR